MRRLVAGAGRSEAVLIVEDEALISLDLCDLLSAAGYVVIGPAATQTFALTLLDETTPALAIVDVQLRDGRCVDLVRELRQRGVPYVIHSGLPAYSLKHEGFDDAPRLVKPASREDLLDAMNGLVKRARHAPRATQ